MSPGLFLCNSFHSFRVWLYLVYIITLLASCHFVGIFVDMFSQNSSLRLTCTWQCSMANLKLKFASVIFAARTLCLFLPASCCVHTRPQPIDFHLPELNTSSEAGRGGRVGARSGLVPCSVLLCWDWVGGPMGGRSVSVWQLHSLLRTSQTESKRSPHGNLMIKSLCDVSGETDTGGKMCPVGSIIQSRQYRASSRHSLMSSTSVNVIYFFVLCPQAH